MANEIRIVEKGSEICPRPSGDYFKVSDTVVITPESFGDYLIATGNYTETEGRDIQDLFSEFMIKTKGIGRVMKTITHGFKELIKDSDAIYREKAHCGFLIGMGYVPSDKPIFHTADPKLVTCRKCLKIMEKKHD